MEFKKYSLKTVFEKKSVKERNELVKSVIPMTYKIARRYYDNTTKKGIRLTLDDYVSAAQLGAIAAAEEYDGTTSKFSTFAYRYIEGYVKRMINQDKYMKKISFVTFHLKLLLHP